MKTLWKNIKYLCKVDIEQTISELAGSFEEGLGEMEESVMKRVHLHDVISSVIVTDDTPMPTLFSGPHHQHYDSVRAISELSRNGYNTVEKLAATHPAVIEAIDGIGPKTMGYIYTRMVQEGHWS